MENKQHGSNAEIAKAFSSAGFVLKTQCQLAKDFGNHGFYFEADFETSAYTTSRLQETVRHVLSEIIERQPSKWLPLMYSLDISEKNYLRFFENAQPGWLADFAQVVIRREAQKVFLQGKAEITAGMTLMQHP